MSINEETNENQEKCDFSFEHSIGESIKYQGLFCHVFATKKIKKLVEPYDINCKEISLTADIPTLTNLFAGLLLEYGNNLHMVYDDLKTCAKQYTAAELKWYGLIPKAL